DYAIGLAIAKNYQLTRPDVSDRFFGQLMRTHPAARDTTAQDWYRALLGRGDFVRAAGLARDQVVVDTAHANFWMRALIECSRRGAGDAALDSLRADPAPAALPWRRLLETEALLRAGRRAEARAALSAPWPTLAPAFTFYYQAEALAGLGDTVGALDLLAMRRATLGDEVYFALYLDALAAGGKRAQLARDFDAILGASFNLPTVKLLCAHLVRWPDATLLARVADRFMATGPAYDNENAGVWFSVVCAAGSAGDFGRVRRAAQQIKQAAKTDFRALDAVEAFFRASAATQRATTILPALPVPLDVTYALLDRYPGPRAPVAAPPARKKP
ncbi:MAG: hypothetical protein RLZZ15_815, partial [Verrucomicrobiota bacterium]